VPSNTRKQRFLEVRKPIGRRQKIKSAIGIWGLFFGVWYFASATGMVNDLLVPAPQQVFATTFDLFVERGFISDVMVSITRVLIAFGMACALAVPLGVMMGTFP
jgi:NitT/TauT family transport system permease protein